MKSKTNYQTKKTDTKFKNIIPVNFKNIKPKITKAVTKKQIYISQKFNLNKNKQTKSLYKVIFKKKS